jgi:lipopolysaccharide biosynthesis protein
MDAPIHHMLQDKHLDLPFCISWANEPWSARWDGSNNNVLIGQDPNINTDLFFADILPFFQDPRYICVSGKPLFMVYSPVWFGWAVMSSFVERMRYLAKKNGLPDLHIVFGKTHSEAEDHNAADCGIDAFVEFPPHRLRFAQIYDTIICNNKFKGSIFDFKKVLQAYKDEPLPEKLTYRTVFPMWDNTARRGKMNAWIFKGTSPATYTDWLSYTINSTKKSHNQENNIVFINAWNEWAEGAHLEPDRKYGYAFLDATINALINARIVK